MTPAETVATSAALEEVERRKRVFLAAHTHLANVRRLAHLPALATPAEVRAFLRSLIREPDVYLPQVVDAGHLLLRRKVEFHQALHRAGLA